jgi:uncharacterized protein (UPF0332 family)
VKFDISEDIIKKEMSIAQSDLGSAKVSFSSSDYKWATVQAYYCMFHCAKALVYSKGFREKSHRCLSIALKFLFVDTNLLDQKHLSHLRDCMSLRQDADYGMIYSQESSKESINWAKDFLDVAKTLLFCRK